MFGLFRKKEKPEEAQAEILYQKVVDAARRPWFYADLDVPDDVDGRFDMITLHESLVIFRLENFGTEAAELSQQLFDRMFLDMDRSLREMGISDLRIPKHMKRMLHGFNGRAQAYKAAITAADEQALKDAIKRNIYGTLDNAAPQNIAQIHDYILRQWAHLQSLPLESFQNGQNIFIEKE